MGETIKPKLTIELVPTTCSFSNVRSQVSKKTWDKLRKQSYSDANNKCEICFSSGRKQGYKHDVECHEMWEYDDENKIQKLVKLISLCPRCHQVKHIGRTTVVGKQKIALKHLELINNWNHKQVVQYLADAFITHRWRSNWYWSLDISVLTDVYQIDKKLIKEGR